MRRYLNVRLIRLRMMWSSSHEWRAKCAVLRPGLAVIPKLSLKLNVIQSLKALCDNLEEPLQFGLVANRTGRRAEHQHGVPGKTVNCHIHPGLRAAIHIT